MAMFLFMFVNKCMFFLFFILGCFLFLLECTAQVHVTIARFATCMNQEEKIETPKLDPEYQEIRCPIYKNGGIDIIMFL